MENSANKSSFMRMISVVLVVFSLAILGVSTPGLTQQAYADDGVIVSNSTLYFGDGANSWSLYTDQSLTVEFADPEAEGHWAVDGNTLTLTNFNLKVDGKNHALILTESCTVELVGDNYLHVEKSDADALCLRVEGDETTIKGSGSLAITTSITTNRASAIEITKQNATLTFNEATVSATAGLAGGTSYGMKLRAVLA